MSKPLNINGVDLTLTAGKNLGELCNPKRKSIRRRSEDKVKRKDLVKRLEEAEKQREFYKLLYRQYSADLVRMALYVRKVITAPAVADYLKTHHESILRDLIAIVMDMQVGASADAIETDEDRGRHGTEGGRKKTEE